MHLVTHNVNSISFCEYLYLAFYLGSGKTAAFLVPILTQIYAQGPTTPNGTAVPKTGVSSFILYQNL
jgi:hypothetical protein